MAVLLKLTLATGESLLITQLIPCPINDNLQQQAETLFKAWFIDFAPFDGVKPDNWEAYTLGEVTEMGAGGDKPKNTSKIKSAECPYPVYSNGLDNEGLYGYTDKAKIYSSKPLLSLMGS